MYPRLKLKDIQKKKNDINKYITVIGDSCIKDNEPLCEPSLEYNPKLIEIHRGTNDLRSEQPADAIAESVVNLAKTIKTDENDVLISGLTPRKYKHGSKCLAVNVKLKKLCEGNNFEFIDNSNIKIKEHLNSDDLHLKDVRAYRHP